MESTTGTRKKAAPKLKDFVNWFEIPALNFEKVVDFYDHIYNIKMERVARGTHSMAVFPANGGKDLDVNISIVIEEGVHIITPETLINEEPGYFAIFIDTEGNKLALDSN